MSLDNALKELREKRHRAQVEIDKLDQIIAGIESLSETEAAPGKTTQPRRVISAASRRKMALAQKGAMGEYSDETAASSGNSEVKECHSRQAHHISGSPQEDRGGTKSTVGEV